MDTTSGRRTSSIGRSWSRRIVYGAAIVAGLIILALPLINACWPLINACWPLINACWLRHSRPHGHSDITLDVSPTGHQIVFNASGTGDWDLYILDLSTLRVRRLADTPAYELTPSFSPDGESVVYAAGLPGDLADHIFVRSIRGGEARQLTAADANDMTPRFSPDGNFVVFARDKTIGHGPPTLIAGTDDYDRGGSIHIVDRDGRDERQLTPDSMFAYSPEFTADGMSVVFFTPNGEFSVPVDGSASPLSIGQLEYDAKSSYVSLISYALVDYAPDYDVFVANADGTPRRQVTRSNSGSFKPVFTPAGDRLLFFRESWPDGPMGVPKYSLWEISVAGEDERLIAGPDLFDTPLAWRGR